MYIVVGEGRSRRFFLTHFTPDGAPRFQAGPPGRTKAARYEARGEAETAAQNAQRADRHGLTWAVTFAP